MLFLAVNLHLFRLQRAAAEDHADYRYESYNEEDGRIEVQTHSAMFQVTLKPRVLEMQGEIVYDAISGASPNGLPPRPGKNQVPVTSLTEERLAGNVSLTYFAGPVSLTPQFSISQENDYDSLGLAFNTAWDLNQKNTTLRAGVAHSFDRVLDNSTPRKWHDKNSTDILIGISQLLSPKTVLTADFTYGMADGYLNDPYKLIGFTGYQNGYSPGVVPEPESRPGRRQNEIVMLTLTQFVDPLNGSAETSYRFYHDSYGIYSHTAALAWYQKIGKHLILAPMFRYTEQSAADFYYVSLPYYENQDDNPTGVVIPAHYSADYRLSHLETFTYGIQATIICCDWLKFDLGYKRYEMQGLDNTTSQSAYPTANIFTIGTRVFF